MTERRRDREGRKEKRSLIYLIEKGENTNTSLELKCVEKSQCREI